MRKAGFMLLWLLAAVIFVPAANATILQYVYTGTLSLADGPDSAGLDGASFQLEALFTLPATYLDGGFGEPFIAADTASLTISGATVAANNGVYFLSNPRFFPKVADLEFDFGFGVIPLSVGGPLTPLFLTVPAVTGKAAVVGGTVLVSDFAPTSSQGDDWFSAETIYDQIGTSINVSIVPEPATTALVGVALIGVAGRWLLRKRAS